MSTLDFITQLFCRVDDKMQDVPKHSQASLHPSEVVTLALLFAIKGVGTRAFYRWISNKVVTDTSELSFLSCLSALARSDCFVRHSPGVERTLHGRPPAHGSG